MSAAWEARYPDIRELAPAGCRTQVQKIVAVDSTAAAFGCAGLDLVTVAGAARLARKTCA